MRDYLLGLGLGLITVYSPAFASEPPDEDGRGKQSADDPATPSLAIVKLKKVRTAGTDAFAPAIVPGYIDGGHYGD